MTDSLRDKITAVLRATLIEGGGYSGANEQAFGEPLVYIDGAVFPAELADAVIRELQLTVLDDGDGIIVGVMHETHESRYCNRCGIPHNTECLRGQK